MSSKSLSLVAAAALALCSFASQAANQIANGGFETAGATATGAASWLGSPANASRDCTVSLSGSCSMMLMSPAFNAAGTEQNSGKDGGMAPLDLGEVAVLSFSAMGFGGSTGDFKARLAYLDGGGNVKYDSNFVSFGSQLSTSSWKSFSITGAAASQAGLYAFVQFYQPIGPIGTGPAGENWVKGQVWVDDVAVVPEPETYAMMLAGLVGVGAMVRRRRSV